MKVRLILPIFLLTLTTYTYSQKVYSVDSQWQAYVKVFVVDSEWQTELNVYKVDSQWQEDLKIFFVDFQWQAIWREKQKIHLIY